LAGATGYLGGHILDELVGRNMTTKAIVRNPQKIAQRYRDNTLVQITKLEVTDKEALENCCDGAEILISTVGITKQKDGLSYEDVDYQANLNLLNEAINSNVKKVIYVGVLNGEKLRHLEICAAKERFVDVLENSGLDYCVIRPNGFFSDMAEFHSMAKKGRVFLFGDGEHKLNPIHGEDLAKVCVESINSNEKEIVVGGPQVLTQNQIADIAFKSMNKKPKITYIPDWVRRFVIKLMSRLIGEKNWGPIHFFLTISAMDMIAPEYGTHTLEQFYSTLDSSDRK
jgi:uncharacterized protein YbjT (DUF2867 family)